MKCIYCNNQTNTYQQYNYHVGIVDPICISHLNSRTTELYTVPDHIPNNQHQLYLYQKYTQFTNKEKLKNE